jgi:hypothetical protein
MKRFEKVKQILDEAVENQDIGAHGAFWRPLNLEAFKAKKVFGQQLLIPGNGAQSNLVRALRGQNPFGLDIGVEGARYPRMPAGGFPPVADDRIAFIEKWINDGCPDDDVQSGT